jgi:two-component system, NarL family, nitrate/nitrite response regulator NarL
MSTTKVRNGSAAIRIVLVDDHNLFREALRLLLDSRSDFAVVGEARNTTEALPMVEREQPDIVLLDLDLNGESGLDLISEIESRSEKSRVLILTGVRDPAIHHQCVCRGARGLVQKEFAAEILIKAVERVHAGEVWFDRGLMSDVLSDVLQQKNAKQADPNTAKIATLTPREREVVSLICEGLRNKQIADRLFISNTTVRHHLTSIFSKLGISDRLELVIFAYRHGLSKPHD